MQKSVNLVLVAQKTKKKKLFFSFWPLAHWDFTTEGDSDIAKIRSNQKVTKLKHIFLLKLYFRWTFLFCAAPHSNLVPRGLKTP